MKYVNGSFDECGLIIDRTLKGLGGSQSGNIWSKVGRVVLTD